jgi:hypothetical protein
MPFTSSRDELNMNQNTGAAILNRLIDPETDDLSSEAARSLLELDFPEADHVRMAELSSKAQAAALTDDDREELQEYIRVADMLAVVQSKVRLSLRLIG